MGDDDLGRDETDEESTADDQRRGSDREVEAERDRGSERGAMGGDPGGRLGDLDAALDDHEYPTTTNELVRAHGDHELETRSGTRTLEEVLAPTKNQTYDSADDVRSRLLGLVRR